MKFQKKKNKNLSVGFRKKYDESQDARNISKHIGSEHHEIIIENELLSFFDRMPEIYDEPFGRFIPNSYSYNFKLCKKKSWSNIVW